MFRKKMGVYAVVLLAVVLMIAACGKKNKEAASEDRDATFLDDGQNIINSRSDQNPATTIEPSDNTNTPQSGSDLGTSDTSSNDESSAGIQTSSADQIEVDLEVTDMKAYYLPSINGAPNLYAAIQVKNNSNKPICVTNIDVQFKTESNAIETLFTPIQNTDDFANPGESLTFAVWRIFDREENLNADSKIEVSASAKGKEWDASRLNRKLLVKNLTLVRNYPNFDTLTGTIENPSIDQNYSLSLVYAAFYDNEDNLLGVWHFTENMAIPSESKNNFAVHLNELPIPNLSENTARIEARGIGID